MAVHLGVALSGPFPRIVDLAAMPFSARAYNPLAAGMPFPRLVDLDLLGFPSSCTLQGYSIVGVGGLRGAEEGHLVADVFHQALSLESWLRSGGHTSSSSLVINLSRDAGGIREQRALPSHPTLS
jgi:hypothetical protein